MYCTKCGHKLDDDALFCTRCGAPTGQIAGFVQPQMQPQPQPQPVQAVEAQPEVQSEVQPYYNEKVNVLFCILSVLFPLVGLIFYLVWADKKPKQAKYCGICTLTAVIAQLAAGIIIGLCVAGFAASGDNTAQGGYGGGSSNGTDLPGTHVPSTPSRVPDAAKYQDTDDGVLTFAYFGEGNNICYDNLTDSIIVWNGGWVGVYGRLDNELKYSFDYTLNVSAVSAYNGTLCVGFGGAARQIAVINLQTGESHIEATDIFVEEQIVTNGYAVFCDEDQHCNLVVLDLNTYTQTMLLESFYEPKLSVNHEKGIVYLVERWISSSDFYYISLKDLKPTCHSEFGQYVYNSGGVYFDGEYVHAFGNTYDAINGEMVANCGYVESINAPYLYLINTLSRNGECSLITEYDNCTVVCNNSNQKVVTTLNVNATEIYHVSGEQYLAVCGDSGYVGLIDLSKI